MHFPRSTVTQCYSEECGEQHQCHYLSFSPGFKSKCDQLEQLLLEEDSGSVEG